MPPDTLLMLFVVLATASTPPRTPGHDDAEHRDAGTGPHPGRRPTVAKAAGA